MIHAFLRPPFFLQGSASSRPAQGLLFLPAAAALMALAVFSPPSALAFQSAPSPPAVKIEGVLGEGGVSRTVTLWIQAEDSLLEAEGSRVVFLEGRAQRQPADSAAWPAVQYTPGHQDAFFMPFAILDRLDHDYRGVGAEAGKRFGRTVTRNRFLGRSGEDFEFEARLGDRPGELAELSISDRQGSEDTRLVYSDYRVVQGVSVPHRVERYLEGTLERVLEVESVRFLPGLDEGLIRIIEHRSR